MRDTDSGHGSLCLFVLLEASLEGGVRLGYEQSQVKRLQRCHRCNREDVGDGEWGYEEGEDEEGGTDDLGDCCIGWDGWPEHSPNAMGEMGRVSNGDFVNSPPRHE